MAGVRVAVVTGSNNSVGLAIVRALCKQFQGHVYLTAGEAQFGAVALKTLYNEGLFPRFHQMDIRDPPSIWALRDYLLEKYGGLDVLINYFEYATQVTNEAQFGINAEVTLKINFFGTRDVSYQLLPIIKPNGRVVNMSGEVTVYALKNCSYELQKQFRSNTITQEQLTILMLNFIKDAKKGIHRAKGWPCTAYGVSKIGVTVLSRIQARELREARKGQGIILNACCPGWVADERAGQLPSTAFDEIAVTPIFLALLPIGVVSPHGELVNEKGVIPW